MNVRLTNSTSMGLFSQVTGSKRKRPQEVQTLVDSSFAELSASEETGYIFTGSENYGYTYYEKIMVSASSMIESKIIIHSNTPLDILDIGAGNFKFMETMQSKYGEKVKMYGISASDIFRPLKHRKTDEYHVIGNAENLSSVFPEQLFDLIFSRTTFIHFVDKIGSLSEAYKKLKPGGMVVIDILPIPGCEGLMEEIVLHLKNQGYLITCQCQWDEIHSLMIQKPSDGTLQELFFPVNYSCIDKHNVKYKPDPAVLKLVSQVNVCENKDFSTGAALCLENANKINSSLFNKYDDLFLLFKDRHYRELNKNDQYAMLIGVCAKSIDLQRYLDIGANLKCAAKNNLFLVNTLKTISQCAGYFLFQMDACIYRLVSPDTLLKCIQLAVGKELFFTPYTLQILDTLNKLNIPYQNLLSRYDDFGANCLQFPNLIAYSQNFKQDGESLGLTNVKR